MAPPTNSTVIVDRIYFNALLRRANFNTTSTSNANGSGNPFEATILVSRGEYDGLRRVAQQYANLRQNLLRGGVDETTVAVLSADDEANQDCGPLSSQPTNTVQTDRSYNGSAFGRPADGSHGYGGLRPSHPPGFPARNGDMHTRQPSSGGSSFAFGQDSNHSHNHSHGAGNENYRYSNSGRPQDSSYWNDEGELLGDEDEGGDDVSQDAGGRGPSHNQGPGCDPGLNQQHRAGDSFGPRPALERSCRRTIQLVSLPESATHADVAAVVRGGLLLDIYIRAHDRSALVSFVREPDAMAFFDHVRKHDLYIKSKRVDIRWGERQFTLPGHVSNKIHIGATRNLVLRQCDARITEEKIREDLDHIHNLVVLSVKFANGSCHISTNSIHNALFARTCMMSRAMYKGSRIDWAPDECAQPLEHVAPVPRPRKAMPAARKPPGFVAPNRFQLLNLDSGGSDESGSDGSRASDGDEGDEDGDDDSTDELHGGGGVFAETQTQQHGKTPAGITA